MVFGHVVLGHVVFGHVVQCVVVQVLSTRARKDVKVADIKVQVCLYAFDCLYLNGQVLVDRPLTERREALYSAIQEKPGELFYATAKVPETAFAQNLLLWMAEVIFPALFCAVCRADIAAHGASHAICTLEVARLVVQKKPYILLVKQQQ